MRICNACGIPYPDGAGTCPHCGARTTAEEDTMSGIAVEPRRNWTFQLLGEVIERAITTGRAAESDRLLRRASKEVDERIAAGDKLDPLHVAMIAGFAVRLALLDGGSEWLAWALTLYRRQRLMVSGAVIDALDKLDLDAFPEMARLVGAYCDWYKQSGISAHGADLANLARLEAFAAHHP